MFVERMHQAGIRASKGGNLCEELKLAMKQEDMKEFESELMERCSEWGLDPETRFLSLELIFKKDGKISRYFSTNQKEYYPELVVAIKQGGRAVVNVFDHCSALRKVCLLDYDAAGFDVKIIDQRRFLWC